MASRLAGWNLAILAALAGAAGAASTACATAAPVEEHHQDEQAQATPAEAAGHARDLLKELYADVRRGDYDGLQSMIAPAVFAVGPGGADVFVSREDAVVALGRAVRAGHKHKLGSHGLHVGAAPGGHSAWADDVIDVDGETYRLAVVLEETDELWTIVAVSVSAGDDGEGGGGGHGKKAAAPALLPGGTDAGAKDAAALFTAVLGSYKLMLDQLAPGAEVAVTLAAGAGDGAHGAKAVRKLIKKRLKTHPTIALDGEPRAGVTPDGELTWIIANVQQGGDDDPASPHRLFVVYRHDDDAWKLVAWHASAGGGGGGR